ncbi:MAG: helix-turn-helix transcriptional regulator [Selenomonadaceae bacterium]|nr:helix-turn-helix transcriptional regulator [Selenomonadaceae bacterium]
MQGLVNQSYRYIGDNVYRFRVLQHMTQEQLAESSQISGAYISQIERANLHKGITCTAMIQIAKSLNVPVCILMAEEPCQNYLDCLSRAAMHRPTANSEEDATDSQDTLEPMKEAEDCPTEDLPDHSSKMLINSLE